MRFVPSPGFVLALMVCVPSMSACGGVGSGPSADAGLPDAPMGLPVLGRGRHSVDAVRVTEIGTRADGLETPRDLAFNPEVPNQLWVVNFADNSAVIFRNTGLPDQNSHKRTGRSSEHFLAHPSSLAFGAPGRLATAHEEHDITQPTTPENFMGPTLWPSDYDTFDGTGNTHLDMLHNSPDAVGIAWSHDNAYWVFDGAHNSLTLYDFHADHGLGGEPHEDGEVARFVEGQVAYVAGVSAGLELDHTTGLLYVADTGNGRVAVLDTTTGRRTSRIGPDFDGTQQYRMANAQISTLIEGSSVGLQRPSGLALRDGTLFVADNANSKVFAFTLDGALIDWLDLSPQISAGGLMGIELSASGELYAIDAVNHRVLRIAPNN